jgi:outer membrane immunogenic protein
MKRALALGIGILALAALPAAAADLPARIPTKAPVMVPTYYNWTGCYLGGYVGGAAQGRDARATDLNGYNGPDTWSYKVDSSFIGGGTLGCNYQTGQFVFGLEGEVGYLSLKGSGLDPFSPFVPLDTTSSTKLGDWYGMITGRAGIAWDRALLYVKGGAAFVNVSTAVNDPILQPVVGNIISASSSSNTKATWTIGGGLEYALTDAWSIKGEYMYIAAPSVDNACGTALVGGGRFCWSHDVPSIHTAKFGINYHFNAGPVVARY